MKSRVFILLFCVFSFILKSQSVIGVDTLIKTGPVSKRINIVVMGDGYTSGQTTQYLSDATAISNYLLATPPFSNYTNYFNVYAIKCVSTQSGVTHPGTATDVTEPASPVTSVTNYFGTRFDWGNIHRLMVAGNSSTVFSVLSTHFPNYDQIIMLGNSTVYGGSGGSIAATSLNSASKDIAVHEIGHSFAGLADEYWAGIGYAAEKPNMTANSNSLTVKWSQWVGINSVGVYPHGASSPMNLWFKPHQSCKMQSLSFPFCSVCQQTIIERIHTLSNPIDAYYPPNATAVTFTSSSQWFKTTLVKPNPNTLKRTWDLNSVVISNNTDSVLVNAISLIPGTNTLKVTVIDTTGLSKDVNHPSLHSYSVIWSINNSSTGIIDVKAQMEYSIFPNPASNFINLKYNLLQSASIVIAVIDANGKTVIRKNLGKQDPSEYLHEIDVQDLSQGNYFLSIQIDNKTYNNQFVIFK
ncbi:MAG: T9SS type A sorting domain-containing protein [Bacteroidia bacterium]|nr:T9SS type A sorting domain-containing protein [Bacteroidia bacterium]